MNGLTTELMVNTRVAPRGMGRPHIIRKNGTQKTTKTAVMTSMSNVPLCACVAVGELRVAGAETLPVGTPRAGYSDTADPGVTTPALIFPEVEARLVDPEVEAKTSGLVFGTSSRDTEVELKFRPLFQKLKRRLLIRKLKRSLLVR